MIRSLSALAATAFLLFGATLNSGAAIVTTIFPDDATADFAHWDTYTGAYAGPHNPDVTNSFSDITLTVSTFAPGGGGGPAMNLGDQLYGGSSTIPSYTIDSTYSALSGVNTIIIQMDISGSGSTLNMGTASLTYGGAPISPEFTSVNFVSAGAGYFAWQFDVTGLSTSSFQFVVNGTGAHTALDDVRVDMSTQSFTGVNLIPEPGSALMAVLAGAGVLVARRRRRA